jgi:predicted alpha/beta-fold hydrolase
LLQFDDLYTAPRWGYADAMDYYAQASSAPRIQDIRVPTFILTSRDDPFIAVAPFDALPALPAVELHISAKGGHLGFLGSDGAGGFRWAETQIIEWMTKRIQPVDSSVLS